MPQQIKRIQASGYNSAAFNANNNCWIWGDKKHCKLGVATSQYPQTTPLRCDWRVLRDSKGRYLEQARPVHKDKQAGYITKVKSIKWGERHGILLDMKGRVFTMGDSKKGRLGLVGDIPEFVDQPYQVTANLPKGENKIVEVFAGNNHNIAVAKNGEMYSWGQGAYGRLGLGYIADSTEIPNQTFPCKLPQVFDNQCVVSVGCGRLFSGVAMQSGSFYMWGKGEHEKAQNDDFKEFSSPKLIMEQKSIIHLAFGVNHVMLLDRHALIYGTGDGSKGCLGFGDGKRRFQPLPLPFFYNKRVIDVACGESFTVVIAEIEGDPEEKNKWYLTTDG